MNEYKAGEWDYSALKLSDFRAFLAKLSLEEEKNKASVSRAVSSIKSFYNYLEREHEIVNKEVELIKSPKRDKLLPKALTKDEVERFIEAIAVHDKQEWINKRNIALTLLIYGTGLRVSEAIGINVNDIDDSGVLTVLGKGKKYRKVPVLPVIIEAIEVYKGECKYNFDEALFIGLRGGRLSATMYQKLVREVRLLLNLADSVTPHALRHSFATHLLGSSGNLRSIQKLLGHESLSSTQIYTKVSSMEMLKKYNDILEG